MDCKQAILQSPEFAGKITEKDFNKIVKTLEDYKKKNPTWTQESLMNHLIEKRKDFINAKIRIYKQLEKIDAQKSWIDNMFSKDKINKSNAEDILYAFVSSDPKYKRLNIENKKIAVENEYMNLIEILNRKDIATILRDKNNAPEFHKEIVQGIWDMDKGRRPVFKYAQAKEAAEAIHAMNKKRLTDLQGLGFDIKALKGYAYSGFSDPVLVRKAGQAQFLADIRKTLDVPAMMDKWNVDERGFNEILNGLYDEFSSSDISTIPGHGTMSELTKDLISPDRLNKIVSSHRELIHKSGESFHEFYTKYSGQNLLGALHRDIRRTARTVAQTEVLGTTPNVAIAEMVAHVNKKLVEAGQEPLESRKFIEKFNAIRSIAVGQANYAEGVGARIIRVLKSHATLALMGNAGWRASLTDPVYSAHVLSTLSRDNYLAAFGKALKTNVEIAIKPAMRREVGKRMDLMNRVMISETLENMTGVTGYEKGLAKVTEGFLKVTGLSHQAIVAREATALNALSYLADMFEGRVDQKFVDADMGMLKNYGFTDTDLAIIKNFGVEEVEGYRIVSAGQLRSADITKVRESLGNPTRSTMVLENGTMVRKELPLSDAEIKDLQVRAARKLGTWANDQALLGSPTPTAVNKYFLSGMNDPNTIAGAVTDLITQFKGFGLSIFRLYKDSAWHHDVADTNKFKRYMLGGRGAMLYTLTLSTIMGAGSLMISDILSGKEPRDPTAEPLDFWRDAFAAGGAGGLYADYVLSEYENGKKEWISDFAGPVLGRMVGDVMDIYGDAKSLDPKVLETTLSKAVRWAPGNNLWISKAFFDRLFVNKLRAWADPKFESKRRKTMNQQSGSLWQQELLLPEAENL